MQIWQDISQRTSPIIWISATTISLILLAVVLSQVDWDLAIEIILKATPVFLLYCLILFLAEGIFTTLRFYVLTPNQPSLSSCFKVTAGYVVFLVLLPARLGEVVVILLLKKYLNQNTSPALMSILVQRLFDVIILSSIFLITAIIMTPFLDPNYLNFFAVILISIISIMLIFFDRLLVVPIKLILLIKEHSEKRWLNKILRLLLQARIWHRHRLTTAKSIQIILLTFFKWICNLGGFVFLMKALQLPLATSNSVVLGAAYNFLAIIPIQTIGGFGISEAGLTSLLLLAGMSLTLAASATIVVRLVIIIVPFLFFGIVISLTKLMTKRVIN